MSGEHRTHAWTKFKLIKGSTKGLMDVDMDIEEQPFQYEVDLERQFGLVLEESDEEENIEETKVSEDENSHVIEWSLTIDG
jgi:hypothetical protein